MAGPLPPVNRVCEPRLNAGRACGGLAAESMEVAESGLVQNDLMAVRQLTNRAGSSAAMYPTPGHRLGTDRRAAGFDTRPG